MGIRHGAVDTKIGFYSVSSQTLIGDVNLVYVDAAQRHIAVGQIFFNHRVLIAGTDTRRSVAGGKNKLSWARADTPVKLVSQLITELHPVGLTGLQGSRQRHSVQIAPLMFCIPIALVAMVLPGVVVLVPTFIEWRSKAGTVSHCEIQHRRGKGQSYRLIRLTTLGNLLRVRCEFCSRDEYPVNFSVWQAI